MEASNDLSTSNDFLAVANVTPEAHLAFAKFKKNARRMWLGYSFTATATTFAILLLTHSYVIFGMVLVVVFSTMINTIGTHLKNMDFAEFLNLHRNYKIR